jgi:hypothetical protein
MRTTLYILCFLFIISSCKKEKDVIIKKDYAIFSGTIKNSKENHFMIIGKHINQQINLNEDGSFLDTLKIKVITTNAFKINSIQIPIYFKNGYNVQLNADANNYINTIKYIGEGNKENEYLLSQFKYGKKAGNVGENGIFSLNETEFSANMKKYKKGLDSINLIYKDIDPALLELTKKQNIKSLDLVKNLYNSTKEANKKQKEALKKLAKGIISPTFNNYENTKGELVSLKDFRGNYVYIEIWGTWIKKYTENAKKANKIKHKYINKNIKFITLCADNKASSGTIRYAKQKWKLAVESNKLLGTHLFAGNDREFLKEYQVRFLPRYILIDPKGQIITAKAPALYENELTKLFKTLKL